MFGINNNNDDNILEKLKKLKKIKFIIIISAIFLFFIVIIAAIIAIIPGAMNGIQSVNDNSSSSYVQNKTGYETGNNSLFSTLCEDCNASDSDDVNGVLGSEFYQKMSEMMNLYDSLEYKDERVDEFDYQLLSATLQYGKLMQAELFTNSDEFGDWYTEQGLTNKDIDNFINEADIDRDNAQQFFKWAAVMLGTPYSLPDINLRGLSGSLVTGKVVTSCVSGSINKSKDDQLSDLIDQIIEVETKLSGENVDNSQTFWDSILSIFGVKYSSDNTVLKERLADFFDDVEAGDYSELGAFINLDYYDPDIECGSGQMVKNTYTKFMNYEQYKEYLRTVFVPQNYINCEKCVLKDASDAYKAIKTEDIVNEIFDKAEYFHVYGGMSDFSYDNVTYSSSNVSITDLSYMVSPLKGSCAVTTGYGRRAEYNHLAVDTITTDAKFELYSIATGKVIKITHFTDFNIGNTYSPTLGTCPAMNGINVNGGIQIVIQYEINGTTYVAEYNHVAADGILVGEGDEVTRGQKIAEMGSTGCSTGVHLHFALYKDVWSADTTLDPTILFKQCKNSGFEDINTIATDDNYVYPEKCMVGDYSLDEIITSIIKGMDSSASSQKEYVKAFAIVVRTKLMSDSDWCNTALDFDIDNIDIDNNPTDLVLYNQVIETQGMVLNYSGALLDVYGYASFPCKKIPTYLTDGNRSYILSTIGVADTGDDLDMDLVNSKISAYNAGCVTYTSSNPVTVILSTLPADIVKYNKIGDLYFHVPSSWVTKTERYAQKKFSTIVAKYMASQGDSYTKILNSFYKSKVELAGGADGIIDISTAPGLIDAKKEASEQLGNNSTSFSYGETLPGSNNIPSGEMSADELTTINENLSNYVSTAETNATTAGDNGNRAKVMAAAYWLINNPFYKVQYGYGHLSQPNVDGWNPEWSSTVGLDSADFVFWSLRQAGAGNIYSNETVLQNSTKYASNESGYSVTELLTSGIEAGDILESRVTNANNSWGIVLEVSNDQCYIKVAHSVSPEDDLTLTTYYCGKTTSFQHIYKLPLFYHDS
ncbi:MAG: M23 family metallopeptidase [Bacilli bacterium]|nr:M23 family metallopeptidase [Bacilli bacterium]